MIVYLSAVEAVEAAVRAVEAEAENAYNRAVVVSSFLSNSSALKKIRVEKEKRKKRERENMRKERDGTYHGDRSNFLSLRVRGRGKEKSEREKRKKQKKLDLRKRVKKSKNNTKKRTDGIHVEKKERRTNEGGIEFPHFSNTLKLHALHTHTHTQQKNTLNHVKSMQATGRERFSFLFASHRDTDWNATREFCSWKKWV